MTARLHHPIQLANDMPEQLLEEVLSFAYAHGMLMFPSGADAAFTKHAPVAVLPSPFPRRSFEYALELAPLWNVLVSRASRDVEFLEASLKNAAVSDDFTGRLMKIWRDVYVHSKPKQTAELGLHRSDYMLHNAKDGQILLHQVEINTISAAFPALGNFTSDLHRFVVEKLRLTEKGYPLDRLPQNRSLREMAAGIAAAHKLYNCEKAVVVMVVQPNEKNSIDQRWLEYELWESHRVRVQRKTLNDFGSRANLSTTNDSALIIDGFEVAVCYFRAGYTPKDYPTEVEWRGREIMEKSRAIKAPSIPYHLVGAKKVQQVLALPGAVERFFPNDPAAAKKLRQCFAGLYSLDEGEAQKIVPAAIAHPHDYVLKPQREGGGNNFYNEDMVQKLKTLSPSELSGYILMDRIVPSVIHTGLVRDAQIHLIDAVSELGIYSTYLRSSSGEEILNCAAGHLLRTKAANKEDGGVAAGVAVLDSPLLVDE